MFTGHDGTSFVDRLEDASKTKILASVMILAVIYGGRTIKQVIQKEGAE
jgi:hypothetical protein